MSLSKTLLLVGVGIASAGVGVAIPFAMGSRSKVAEAATNSEDAADTEVKSKKGAEKSDSHDKADSHAKSSSKKDDGHGKAEAPGKSSGHGSSTDAATSNGPQFVQFGRIVVNLNEPALTKYLSLDITLLTDGKDAATVTTAVESRLPILRTWLTSHLADKSMEDVRGKVGINRLRHEIQDQFNALLFDDGHERVKDVLFEEFHVE